MCGSRHLLYLNQLFYFKSNINIFIFRHRLTTSSITPESVKACDKSQLSTLESSTALLASQYKLAANQVHWRQIFCEVLLRLRKQKLCLSVITYQHHSR